jgi:hypothetical protein
LQVGNLAHPCNLAGAARQLVDNFVFEAAQPVHVDPRLAEVDAPLFRMRRFVQDFCDVQECLRRDTAAIQTHAARVFLGIDERDLHPEICRVERGRIPTGTGANDCDSRGH